MSEDAAPSRSLSKLGVQPGVTDLRPQLTRTSWREARSAKTIGSDGRLGSRERRMTPRIRRHEVEGAGSHRGLERPYGPRRDSVGHRLSDSDTSVTATPAVGCAGGCPTECPGRSRTPGLSVAGPGCSNGSILLDDNVFDPAPTGLPIEGMWVSLPRWMFLGPVMRRGAATKRLHQGLEVLPRVKVPGGQAKFSKPCCALAAPGWVILPGGIIRDSRPHHWATPNQRRSPMSPTSPRGECERLRFPTKMGNGRTLHLIVGSRRRAT
jgi:hypothetical protein